MQCGQEGSELKEDVDTVGPDSYIFLSDQGEGHATPKAAEEARDFVILSLSQVMASGAVPP